MLQLSLTQSRHTNILNMPISNAHKESHLITLERQTIQLDDALKNHISQHINNVAKRSSIRTANGKELISIEQIILCEAHGNYAKLYLADRRTHI